MGKLSLPSLWKTTQEDQLGCLLFPVGTHLPGHICLSTLHNPSLIHRSKLQLRVCLQPKDDSVSDTQWSPPLGNSWEPLHLFCALGASIKDKVLLYKLSMHRKVLWAHELNQAYDLQHAGKTSSTTRQAALITLKYSKTHSCVMRWNKALSPYRM